MQRIDTGLTCHMLKNHSIDIVYSNEWYVIAKISDNATDKEKKALKNLLEEMNPENPESLIIDINIYNKARRKVNYEII